MSFHSKIDRLFHIKHHTHLAPAPRVVARPLAPADGFDPAPRATPTSGGGSEVGAGGPVVRATSAGATEAGLRVTGASAASAVGPVVSPYYQGRIGRDGKQFVGPTGQAFNYRGVSEFLLPRYLNDTSRSPEENEQLVGARMDERVKQGYSVMRVFGNVAWDSATLKPFENWEAYKQNTEKLFSMAKDRGMYIEFTAFTDTSKTIPDDKRGEYIDFVAQLTQKYDNSFVEICNESFKNGLSDQEVYDLGKRFKRTAPGVMLAGSSPTADGGEAGAVFGKDPFDYTTLHSERSDGDDGFRWVRHMREGESVSGVTGKPVVQDEPIGSAGANQPGRRDSNPQHFRDAALVAAVTGQGFTFHTERAVTADPRANVAEPGADATQVSDLIPIDNRGTHFVNGHWADSPFDVGNQFDSNVLRVFTKMKNDGSGFWTYPVQVKNDLDLKVKNATHLTVKDVMTGEKLIDRDFAAGENLRLPKGSDVVIYGGNAEQPEVKKVTDTPVEEPKPPVQLGSPDPLPAQRKTGSMKTAPYSTAAATEIVERLYKGLLGREADRDGMTGWVGLVARGGLRDAINGMMGSPEFAARKDSLTLGGTATGLYRAILDRDPDLGGLEGTQSLLKSGLMAERTAAMLMSQEYRERH